MVVGLILAVGSGAGIWLYTAYPREDRKIEEAFCRFTVCDPVRVVVDSQKSRKPEDFFVLVKRDPHFPLEWADYGEALAEAGKNAEAEYAFKRAVEFGPHWPPVTIKALRFHLQHGNRETALAIGAGILDQVDTYDSEIFAGYLSAFKDDLSVVMEKGLPKDDPRAIRAWLAFILYRGKWEDTQKTWDWATSRGLIDTATANKYTAWLLLNHPEAAPKVWKAYLGQHADAGYLKTNYVMNSGFELPFSGSLMDWTFAPSDGVDAGPDRTNPASGSWCVRVQFDGQHNLGYIGLRQDVVLPPGRFRFKARVRCEGITTDQGVQLRLSPDWVSEAFVGTRPWSSIDLPITNHQTKVYQIQLTRTPSIRFDNKLAGTIWLDDVRIEPM